VDGGRAPRIGSGGPAGTADHVERERRALALARTARRAAGSIVKLKVRVGKERIGLVDSSALGII
jgi:hypothetical protein